MAKVRSDPGHRSPPVGFVSSPIFYRASTDIATAGMEDAAMDTTYDETHELSCARGIVFGLAFVTPFWIVLIALLIAL
jgi:hypothetical protein